MFGSLGSKARLLIARPGSCLPGSRSVQVLPPSRVNWTCPPKFPNAYVLQVVSSGAKAIAWMIAGEFARLGEPKGLFALQTGVALLKKLSVRQRRLVPV